jgi:hypothetical protein
MGDRARTLSELHEAVLGLETTGLAMQALSARRVLGAMMGGSMGRDLTHQMDETMRNQGVENTARFVELMVPGFAAPMP